MTQQRTPLVVGMVPYNVPTDTALQLAAANTWLAFGILTAETKTLAKVRAYVSSVAGSLGAGDLSCAVYSDSGGNPGTQLSVSTTLAAPVAATTWIEWTGFAEVLTAGTQYWLVMKNLNGTPATNAPTFRFGSTSAAASQGQSSNTATTYGWHKKHTTDGTSWVSAAAQSWGWRGEYSDATVDGLPISGVSTSDVTYGVYSAREAGVKFTTPANCRLVVRGIYMGIGKQGTPTGTPRFRLYAGTTLVATTHEIPAGVVTATSYYAASFSAAQTLDAATLYRVALGESTQADASANRWNTPYYLWQNTVNSLTLRPFAGTMEHTYFDGTSWADQPTLLAPMGLILDTSAPFAAQASSGGIFIVNE